MTPATVNRRATAWRVSRTKPRSLPLGRQPYLPPDTPTMGNPRPYQQTDRTVCKIGVVRQRRAHARMAFKLAASSGGIVGRETRAGAATLVRHLRGNPACGAQITDF